MSASAIWLDLRLAWAAAGWAKPAATAAIMVAAVIHWGLCPQIAARTEEIKALAMHDGGPVTTNGDRSTARARLDEFSGRLAAHGERGTALKSLFSEAEKAGVSLLQADYQISPDSAGGFSRLQITLPVKGTYAGIRAFVGGLLAALPALSVDDISFRRESIRTTLVEARIRLTLHMRAQE